LVYLFACFPCVTASACLTELCCAAAKASGANLRVHFKNVVEVAAAVKGKTLERAKKYLSNVLEHKEAIPVTNSKGGRGRHSQAKNLKAPGSLVFWPRNATKFVLDLLTNAEANAESKGLDVTKLYVSHAQANQAPKGRRRTYRAHGRIGPYMSVPAHIELILTEKDDSNVEKPEDAGKTPRLFKKKLAARFRVAEGARA
jgi:large subunit ribosomal protein L17e